MENIIKSVTAKALGVNEADVVIDYRLMGGMSNLMYVIVVNGEGVIRMEDFSADIKKGDSIFIPAQNGSFTVSGNCELIISYV